MPPAPEGEYKFFAPLPLKGSMDFLPPAPEGEYEKQSIVYQNG